MYNYNGFPLGGSLNDQFAEFKSDETIPLNEGVKENVALKVFQLARSHPIEVAQIVTLLLAGAVRNDEIYNKFEGAASSLNPAAQERRIADYITELLGTYNDYAQAGQNGSRLNGWLMDSVIQIVGDNVRNTVCGPQQDPLEDYSPGNSEYCGDGVDNNSPQAP